MIQYADNCLVFASNKVETIAKISLESNIHNLANYFRKHQLNLNSSKTELIGALFCPPPVFYDPQLQIICCYIARYYVRK